ncbi:DUF1176 domain-containing protein [Stappia sp.]|uniref:DUF1176 domain-containing protein n=1 Tax=Stappia sp. TaxID=1870903 RepID=UPI003A98E28B
MFPRRAETPVFPLRGLWLTLLLVCAPTAQARDDTGGWRVSCAAQAPCFAEATGVDAATGAPVYRLRLERTLGGIALAFETSSPRPDDRRAMQWEIDDRPVHVLRPDEFAPADRIERLHVTAPRAGRTLVEALRQGQGLRISFLDALGGAHEALFSLSGSRAAMDELASDTGDAGAFAPIPPARRLPRLSREEAVRALGVPYAVLERHARTSDCEASESPGLADAPVVIGVLSDVATFYALPCTSGTSGGETYRLYLRDSGEIGGVETLVFAVHDPRFGWVGTDLLPRPRFNADTGELTAEHVGPSDRHCGYRATWKWQDYAFRLASLWGPDTCKDAARPARWQRIHPPG